ncbi:GNAT family N-acetyltransferase [Geosporobacter ferrireducens]|uniref:N-acetyltransferase domain-containing protein n=1 Tax=Geosporobacter ferrireducens TaxID=1424294 RepID=A0A1D8GEJ1_9FIRM|nr:GNAT family N-acetyltransferase [Geosporobacter ferrireducens]AOT69332.1 hypothetical protein Gferi_06950 [Geosporobacter ferrireducens]MTI57018.1 GNAT family N-acetyltransferase [Geosporobacter ferrireducens]
MCIQFILAQQKDCDLLFQWTNDIDVRNNSFCSEPIAYESHVEWFHSKTCSDQCLLYVCYHGEEPIGQIRIDILDGIGFINYSVAKAYRGKGYGTMMLKGIFDVIQQNKTSMRKLLGRVKHENIPSQRAFEKAAYAFRKEEGYIEYYKEL